MTQHPVIGYELRTGSHGDIDYHTAESDIARTPSDH
jgi:hypothetical protein